MCVRLLLLVGLHALAAPVAAQSPIEIERPRATAGQKGIMALGGHFGGGLLAVATVGVTSALNDSFSSENGALMVVTLYPLGVAAASYGIGQAFGATGTFQGTVGGAYLGAGLGVLVAGAVVSQVGKDAESLEEVLGLLVLGGTIYIGSTLFGAVRGYDASVQPMVLRSLDGQTIPAARLTISF